MNRDDVKGFRNQSRDRKAALVLRNRLMNDSEFGALVSSGDYEALGLIGELSRQIVGSPEAWSKPPENFGRTRDDTLGERPEVV